MIASAEITASPRLRRMFGVAAAVMLSFWAWSFVPPIQNWNNPNEDGFSYVALFYATLICLPLGIFLLVGAMSGRGRSVRFARVAFLIAAVVTFIVVAFNVIAGIANNNNGKVFGIQIGFQRGDPDGVPRRYALM